LSRAQDEKRLSVYTPQTSYTLAVLERDGRDYVGLLEALEPMGSVSAKPDEQKWKLYFNNSTEAQFTEGRTRAKIRNQEIELGARFLLENGRGLVPVHALPELVQRFTGAPVDFREAARRLFVGQAGVRVVSETKAAPGRVVLTFSAPVNPFIATEPGKLRLVFSRDPLVVGPTSLTRLDDPLITGTQYSEANGAAEVTVFANAPLMATFSDDRRALTIAAQAPPAAAATTNPPTVPPPAAPAAPAHVAGSSAPAQPRFLVAIDPGHGGDDRGALLSEQLAEKEVTLAFARRLHRELENHGIAARLLRDADATIAPDQRANAANLSGSALYISVHAAGAGNGVRVFTSTLPPGYGRSGFVAWDTAQSAFVASSELLAADLATELLKRDIPAVALGITVPPLNHVAAPALAIEVAPPPKGTLADLTSAAYQQAISAAIAEAIASSRTHLPHGTSGQ
jgi:N-acetylmuramoyl-L-alanine amidase